MLEYVKGYTGDIRVWVGGDRQNLSWAEFDFSGNLICECVRGSFLFPGLTDEEMEEAKAAISRMGKAPYDNAYIRFNDLPAGGKSKNHATGMSEEGVSCYALRWDFVNQCYKRTGSGLDGAMISYAIKGAPVYFITGEECGTGSDGEPLLKNAKVLSEAVFSADKDGYVIKGGD